MEKKVLLKQLVDAGTHVRREFIPTAIVSDYGTQPIGEFWDANKTVDVIVNGAHAMHDTVRETDEYIHHVNNIKTGRIGWDDSHPITDITALTNAQIDSLKTGDTVIKTTGDQKHSYTVAYKKDNEMSLVYTDCWTIEEVYYEKNGNNWQHVVTDVFKPEDYQLKITNDNKLDYSLIANTPTVDSTWVANSTNAVESKLILNTINQKVNTQWVDANGEYLYIDSTGHVNTIDPNFPSVITTSNITAMTDEQLNALKPGDVVVKITGNMKHTYTVSYKEENKGICITYGAAGYLETVSYDYDDTENTWVYNSTDVTTFDSLISRIEALELAAGINQNAE